MIAIDLSKQQASTWRQSKSNTTVDFTQNLDQRAAATIFFIIEEAKETVLDFSEGAVKVF